MSMGEQLIMAGIFLILSDSHAASGEKFWAAVYVLMAIGNMISVMARA